MICHHHRDIHEGYSHRGVPWRINCGACGVVAVIGLLIGGSDSGVSSILTVALFVGSGFGDVGRET